MLIKPISPNDQSLVHDEFGADDLQSKFKEVIKVVPSSLRCNTNFLCDRAAQRFRKLTNPSGRRRACHRADSVYEYAWATTLDRPITLLWSNLNESLTWEMDAIFALFQWTLLENRQSYHIFCGSMSRPLPLWTPKFDNWAKPFHWIRMLHSIHTLSSAFFVGMKAMWLAITTTLLHFHSQAAWSDSGFEFE